MAELWALLSDISLGSGLTIVGTVAVVTAFLIKYFGRDKAWEDQVELLEKQIIELQRRIDGIEYPQQHYDRQLAEMKTQFSRQEEKLERLTNLLIEYFSSRRGDNIVDVPLNTPRGTDVTSRVIR